MCRTTERLVPPLRKVIAWIAVEEILDPGPEFGGVDEVEMTTAVRRELGRSEATLHDSGVGVGDDGIIGTRQDKRRLRDHRYSVVTEHVDELADEASDSDEGVRNRWSG
jgi:hypothetical protein